MQPRYWHTRFLLVFVVLALLLAAWREPASLMHQIISRSGTFGWTCVAGLACVCGLALADIFINDWLPTRFTFKSAARWRFLVYMGLSMGLASLCAVVVHAVGRSDVLVLFIGLSCFAVQIAGTDLIHRHRSNP